MSAQESSHSAVRRLSAGHGDPTERVEAARALGEHTGGDRNVVRALVQGLWDDDEAVRDACESALEQQLTASDDEGRRMLVDVLFVNLAGDPDPPREVASFLVRLVGWVRRHRTEHPDLFGDVLMEAERARSGGSYSQPVSRALKRLYNESSTDDSQSTELVDRFNRRQALDQLRSETAPPGEVEYAIRLFGDQSISEVTFEVLLYHLVPVRISHSYQVMNKAVQNLRDWTDDLPREDLFELTDAVDELADFRRGHRDALPPALRNEIALAEVAVAALTEEIERLRELPQYERVLTPALEALDGVSGVRDHVETVTEVAADETGEQRNQAIAVLSGLLTGLDTDVRHNRDRIRRVYDDAVAETDAEIRQLFERLATDPSVDDDAVREMVRSLVRSRPDDLEERFGELVADRSVEDPAVRTALDTVAEEAVLSVTSVLEAVLNELPDGNAADARAVVETLEALGHDAARRALFQAMESRAGPVGAQARDALVRSGYYEQVRATDTRTRATEHASASETARDDRRDAEERRRDERYEYKDLEATLREEVFESDQALRRGLEAVIERRIDSVDTLVELYETDRRVEMLIDRASAQHSELGAYLERIPLGEDVRNGIEEELRTIEKELDHLERLAEGDAERARALQRRLDRLETESETVAPSTPDDESLAAEHRAKLRAQERESIERLRDRYRTAASDRADRVAELRTAFERKRSRLGDGSADPGGSVTDIQAAIERIESQAGRIESLTRRREQEWDRVVEAMNEYDQEVEAAIESLRETAAELERVSSRIDDLTEEISDLRLAQQHQSQRSKEQRETFREVEPRARGDARHQAEMATERAEFYEHRHVYAEFIRRHYEMQLDVVGDRQFRERHGDDIDRIEAELDRYLE